MAKTHSEVGDLSWVTEVAEHGPTLDDRRPIWVRHAVINSGASISPPHRHAYCECDTRKGCSAPYQMVITKPIHLYFLWLFVTFLTMCCIKFTAAPMAKHFRQSGRTTDTIKSKRAEIRKINATRREIEHSQNHYIKVIKGITGTDDGGRLVAWVNNSSVVKITVWLGLSNKRIYTTYYFRRKQLCFVSERACHYTWDEKRGVMDRDRCVLMYERNYFFNNNKLIRIAVLYGLSPSNIEKLVSAKHRGTEFLHEANAFRWLALRHGQSFDLNDL